MTYKSLCLSLIIVLLAAFLPSTTKAGDNVGKVYLVFKYCRQDVTSDEAFNADACTGVKPAGGVQIVFQNDDTRSAGKTRSDGVIESSIQQASMV